MKTVLIQIIEDNIFANYKGVARLLEGQFIEDDEVAWYNTGRRSYFRFNGVVRTVTRTEDLSRVVDPILDVFLSQNIPFFWADWQDAGTPGLGDYLNSKGINFIYLTGVPVMSRELDELPEQALPKDVEIVQVQTQQQQADWLNVMMEGFQEPEPARPDVQKYVSNSLTEPTQVFEHFLAYWQGQPCAISTLLRAGLGAGIYNVTTLPAYRGRGLGRTLTLTAMWAAREFGYKTAILFATPSGLPIYQGLGFETVSAADLFIWNGAEQAAK
ncbi:MAG: GNAT family N-acetyltransferase [Chloroflexi bacterium]|nr:GNAT family N-acetyltransferase [Chloroflexota bacterium]